LEGGRSTALQAPFQPRARAHRLTPAFQVCTEDRGTRIGAHGLGVSREPGPDALKGTYVGRMGEIPGGMGDSRDHPVPSLFPHPGVGTPAAAAAKAAAKAAQFGKWPHLYPTLFLECCSLLSPVQGSVTFCCSFCPLWSHLRGTGSVSGWGSSVR
jgi:hypothetical protein